MVAPPRLRRRANDWYVAHLGHIVGVLGGAEAAVGIARSFSGADHDKAMIVQGLSWAVFGGLYAARNDRLTRRIRSLEDTLNPPASQPRGTPRPVYHYERGGPEPSGHGFIYAEVPATKWKVVPTTNYLAFEVQLVEQSQADAAEEAFDGMPTGLQSFLEHMGIRAHFLDAHADPDATVRKIEEGRHLFRSARFKQDYPNADLIKVHALECPSETADVLIKAARTYRRTLMQQAAAQASPPQALREDTPAHPPPDKPFGQMTSAALTEYLSSRIGSYQRAIEEGNQDLRSQLAFEMRRFAEGTVIEVPLNDALRIAQSAHPRKHDLTRLIVQQCSALRDEQYEAATALRDQIKAYIDLPTPEAPGAP